MSCANHLDHFGEGHESWRNIILHDIVRELAEQGGEKARVPIIPLGEMTLPLWDAHIGGADCTHWCYMPGFIDGFLHEIARVLLA